ncbi:VOC family protein [Tenacibaculum xiamenense]|uniref:VOC family protein n=1 Tax=Tenacibaculum xiamenense TaxID=1261553 RepID=UPI0038959F25
MNALFHMSLPCKDLDNTLKFYTYELGFDKGRKTDKWVDINLFGNQLTFVLIDNYNFQFPFYILEKERLPSFHFGVILENDHWDYVYDQVIKWSEDTIVKTTFFEDKHGEQSSFFVKDPNDYYIEFKTFKEHNDLFI